MVAAISVLLLSSCGGSSSSTANTPVSTPKAGPLHLLVLGDSIAIPKMGCGSCEGFDRQYAAYLEKTTGRSVELSNQARGGAGILDLQSLLDSDAAVQSEVTKADVVVVSIGYNSGPPFAADEPCHAPDAVHDIDQLNAILNFTPECVQDSLEIRKSQLDSVYAKVEALAGCSGASAREHCGVFNNTKENPGGDGTFADFPAADRTRVEAIMVSLTNDWNTMNSAVATVHGFVCADLYHAFNGPDGTGSLKSFVAADFTHPSETGQRSWQQLLEKVPLDQLH